MQDITDRDVEIKIERAVSRELKKELYKRCHSIIGYPFIDTDNPVYMTKLGLRLEQIVYKGVDMMAVYHETLPYPIYKYNITPFSTHTLSVHKNGTMVECEYPALAYSNQDSLDWKLFDLKIIHTDIVSSKDDDGRRLMNHIRKFYIDASDNWFKSNLNTVIPFLPEKKAGVYIHMYRSRKSGGLKRSAAIYDNKGRLFMFMGVDTLIANADLLYNYTETEFFKTAVYLSIVTGKDSDIIKTDGAYKMRSHESKIGYAELVSTVGLEYGIIYGKPEIIDTSKLDNDELDFANYRRKRRESRKA